MMDALVLLLFCVITIVNCQFVSLVKDIVTTNALFADDIVPECAFGTKLFLSARSILNGREVFVSDTVTGVTSQLVLDLVPDETNGAIMMVAAAQDFVLIAINDGAGQVNLFKSNGTARGTVLTHSIPEAEGPTPGFTFAALGNTVFYIGHDSSGGFELYRSDGTASGTSLVKDINEAPGEPDFGDEAPKFMTPVPELNLLFFLASTDGLTFQLYKTDAAGTEPVVIATPTIIAFGVPVAFGPLLYFPCIKDDYKVEICKTDGDTFAIVTSLDATAITQLTVAGSSLFFTANNGSLGDELYVTDGTAAGTFLVSDINPAGSSNPSSLAAAGSKVYFVANNGDGTFALYKSNGTAEGTIRLGFVNSYYNSFAAIGSTAFFAASTPGVGIELFKDSDEGTDLVKDINPGAVDSAPGYPVVVGDTLFFITFSTIELFKTDGEIVERVVVNRRTGSLDITGMVASGSNLLFAASDGVNGLELFISDGNAAGTGLFADLVPGPEGSSPQSLTAVSPGTVFFAANVSTGVEPWTSDGTVIGTQPVADIVAGPGSSEPFQFVAAGSNVFFIAETSKLFVTAGGTTTFIIDLELTNNFKLVAMGSLLFFTRGFTNGFVQVWRSDGTPGGTFVIVDDNDGITFVYSLGVIGSTLFVSGFHTTLGSEVFKTNSTGEVVELVTEIVAGDNNLDKAPQRFVVAGTTLYFVFDQTSQSDLWRTNGTSAGTELVMQLRSTGNYQAEFEILAVDSAVFFVVSVTASAVALFTAGSNGVVQLTDGNAQFIFNLVAFDGEVYFNVYDFAGDLSLWVTDGVTDNGARLVKAFPPQLTDPVKPVSVGSLLFFAFEDSAFGLELWKLTNQCLPPSTAASNCPIGSFAIGTIAGGVGEVCIAIDNGVEQSPGLIDADLGGCSIVATGPDVDASFSRFYETCIVSTDASSNLIDLKVVQSGTERTISFGQCGTLLFEPGGADRRKREVSTVFSATSLGVFRVRASGSGDPHLVGAHGEPYEFVGEPDATYVLFSAPQFVVNMHLDNVTHGARFMKSIGVRYRNFSAVFSADFVHGPKFVARLNQQLEPLGGRAIALSKVEVQLDLCAGQRVKISQKWTAPRGKDHKSIAFVNALVEAEGCHDSYDGALGQTFKCKYASHKVQFHHDRATEENFRVPSILAASGSFAIDAPCIDVSEYTTRHDIVSGTMMIKE